MELIRIAAGLVLFVAALAVNLRVQRRIAGWPRAERVRIAAVPVAALVAYFAICWTVAVSGPCGSSRSACSAPPC